jgi:hypothetical protein
VWDVPKTNRDSGEASTEARDTCDKFMPEKKQFNNIKETVRERQACT